MEETRFIADREIYTEVLLDRVPEAEKFLWIATADLKDLHVEKGSQMVPFLEVLSDLIEESVSVRLMHAKEPGPIFREDFDNYPELIEGMERLLCPRCHLKTVIIDGEFAYIGSANLTGAGMGAKSDKRRNFESGIITTNAEIIEQSMEQFDDIWMGNRCENCDRKDYCADYHDLLP